MRMAKMIVPLLLITMAANAQTAKHRYADAPNGVTFEYSSEWRAVDADKDTHYMRPSIQPVQAAFVLDTDPAPYDGTDFASLSFNYIVTAGKTAAACRTAINPYGDAAPAPAVTVNGRTFDSVNAGDSATGHQIAERLYSTFANDRCYVFDLELVTSGYGVADDQDIRQMFQPERDDAQKRLDAIFGTVHIEKLK
jgi:hypothetical protein